MPSARYSNVFRRLQFMAVLAQKLLVGKRVRSAVDQGLNMINFRPSGNSPMLSTLGAKTPLAFKASAPIRFDFVAIFFGAFSPCASEFISKGTRFGFVFRKWERQSGLFLGHDRVTPSKLSPWTRSSIIHNRICSQGNLPARRTAFRVQIVSSSAYQCL
jgi:hypothetical protein